MSDVEQIEKAAFAACVTLAKLFRTAGVDPSTFYSAKRTGRAMKPITVAKLMRAIKELSR